MNPLALLVPAVVFCTALLVEALLVDRARRKLRIVIRVTGTRGKSSVTRMIHAVLRDAGYTAWAKTTGTEARRILADGTEVRIRRLGPGNIREQRNTLFRAVRAGADALVLECNALRPALMAAAGRYVREDVLVITNVRDDHPAEQGSLTEAATAMIRSTVPGATVITTDGAHEDLYRAEAEARGGRCIIPAPRRAIPDDLPDEPMENAACTLAVAEYLGIPRSAGVRSIRGYRRDPGSFSLTRWTDPENRRIIFADALAANDPESTEKLLERTRALLAVENESEHAADRPTDPPMGHPARRDILVIAHRPDRPDRTLRFVRWAFAPDPPGAGEKDSAGAGQPVPGRPGASFSHVVVFGACPLGVRYFAARAMRRKGAERTEREEGAGRNDGEGETGFSCTGSLFRLERLVAAEPPETQILLFAAGNWQGYGAVLRKWRDRLGG